MRFPSPGGEDLGGKESRCRGLGCVEYATWCIRVGINGCGVWVAVLGLRGVVSQIFEWLDSEEVSSFATYRKIASL